MTQHIQKVLDGDTEAFRFIIKEHKDRAYTIALSVMKDEFAAKEVVQTAFIQAYQNLDTFRSEAKFSTWLHRIVINEAFKKSNKNSNTHTSLDNVKPAKISPDTNQTFTKMEDDYQQFYVTKALKQLPANYSLALRLFYLQNYSIAELSDVTGWTQSNAKVILHRARKKMKYMLSEVINFDQEKLF